METKPSNLRPSLCRILRTLLSGKLLVILIEISMLNLLLPLCFSLTCPSSSSKSNVISTEKFTFVTDIYGVLGLIAGPVSHSMYYLYSNLNYNTTLRKLNQDNSIAWMISLNTEALQKSLNIDSGENNIYFICGSLVVCRFSTSTGAFVDAQGFTNISPSYYGNKIHVLSDNSGYYTTGTTNPRTLSITICKYMFSSPENYLCQTTQTMRIYSNGDIRISDTSLFMLGEGSDLKSGRLLMYKITFGNESPDWANYLRCPGISCSSYSSESVLINSTIYSFFIYGEYHQLYLASMSSTDGSVSSKRYKNLSPMYSVDGLVTSGNNIIVVIKEESWSSDVLIYNIETTEFIIKSYGTSLYCLAIEPETERVVLGGFYEYYSGKYGYTPKFMIQSISAHPDLNITANWKMNILPSGTEEILPISGEVLGDLNSYNITSFSISNITVTYKSVSNYTSDVNFITSDQSISVQENITSQVTLDLPCSISGSTPITFAIANYMNSTVPDWISIDSLTGTLTIQAPAGTSDKEYSFYINSLMSYTTGPILKLIRLNVFKCSVSHCQRCIETDGHACKVCDAGYSLHSGACDIQASSSL